MLILSALMGGPLWLESRVTGGFPHKWTVMQSFIFHLLSLWTICWKNNPVAGDVRHYDPHVTAQYWFPFLYEAKNDVFPNGPWVIPHLRRLPMLSSSHSDYLQPISQKWFKVMWSKICKIMFRYYPQNNYCQIRSQFCTCHDSSAVVTCANLWPDWAIKTKNYSKEISSRFQLWAH